MTVLERILAFSIRRRGVVLLVTALFAATAASFLPGLPIDAVPDITNVQVQVNVEATGYSPLEVEQRVTFPIETALAGIPGLVYTRSLSRYGLSQVTAVFADGTDVYFARQIVNERLQEAKAALPAGLVPTMGPIATGLGEITMYTLSAKPGARAPDGEPWDGTRLRTIHDWVVRPQLRTVPGVVEVNTIGGGVRQFEVAPRIDRLVAFGLDLDDVARALERNNANVGAGYVESHGEQQLVRIPGQVATIDELARIPVATRGSVPIRVEDVAEVRIGHELRTGAATQNGEEVVLGTVFMLFGENSRIVARRAAERLERIARTLPEGVVLEIVYDRTKLVDATLETVSHNLALGALLVVVVLFALVGNLRASLVTAAVIPLAMLFAASAMRLGGVTGNLMSLGALDFGLVVDGAVIIVENCVRRLGEARARLGRELDREEREAVLLSASQEVRRATIFGELIITVVYLPILTLTGVEGKMYVPMAFTVVAALAGAMLLSVTFVPAACAAFLSSAREPRESPIVRLAERAYRPVLDASFRHVAVAVAASLAVVALAVVLARGMGREFVPRLDEGDVALHAIRAPGTSLTQAIEMQHVLEERVSEIAEVERVFSKIGTGDVATDPMPPEVADGLVMLAPRERWPDPGRPKREVVAELEEALERLPGNVYEFTQPIEMRFNELIAGVRADLAIKVFGDDLEELGAAADRIAELVRAIPGAADVRVESVSGLPFLLVRPDRAALARYGLDVAAVQKLVRTAVAGREVGVVYEGDRRFDVVVRLPRDAIGDPAATLANLPLALPSLASPASGLLSLPAIRHPIERSPELEILPLRAVADLVVETGPNQVSRENGKRRVVVTANVRGRDLGSFVAEARAAIDRANVVPSGSWIGFGGQFEHLLSATARLRIVVPIVFVLIFALLHASFGSTRDALLIFTGIPLALSGGVIALWLRDIPLSISAAVGFIALSGVAVLNGLVLVSQMRRLIEDGVPIAEAAREGALRRLRPVLMTALVASLGFVPMAIATGRGAEVQRPLATVVIGGLVTSTILTLVLLPALYSRLVRDGRRAAPS